MVKGGWSMRRLTGVGLALAAAATRAAPETYLVDEEHTFAYYEIDHVGFSTSRGRFDQPRPDVLDRAARTGSVEIASTSAAWGRAWRNWTRS